jgi:tetratricopeptide (TPR) repeat protein
MSDNPLEPTSLPEVGTSATITNVSGGVNLDAQHDVNIVGDAVGHDKTTTNIDTDGGAYLAGDVNVSEGSEYVGRDKIVNIYKAPAPIATSLHQLPPPPRDFTGREAELAELLTKAEADGVTISGLQGMGGVGKTALSLVFAERLKARYPDAQLYLDLKGADKQPLPVTAALTHVIRAYQPTAKLPDSEAELRGLYLSVLNSQRALLVMDNAADKAQVEPLIPPSSCFLLVTSRQHFTLPGLFAKDLNTLPPNEARDLLLTIAPRIGDQLDTLAKLCGYLPLALRLAGSALVERRTLTPLDYVKRLEDAQTRLDLVEAPLSLSYDLLGEDLQRAWCALAVFPDTFDITAVATVWEAETETAQDWLGELVRYSVVEWNETSARARLHDLARLFADKHLSDVARMDSLRRHAIHYASVLIKVREFYEQGGDGVLHGLRLFDLERVNIEAGQAWAAEHAEADDTAAKLCSIYPLSGVYVFDLRQHPREQIRWLEAALAATRRLNLRDAEVVHLGNLGIAYSSLGEYRRAIEYYEQVLAVEREISAEPHSEGERTEARRGEAASLGGLGNAYSSLGEYRRAIEYHEQALAIAEEIGDRRGESASLGGLGDAYSSLGEYRRAIEYHVVALDTSREIGDRRGEAKDLSGLGSVFYNLEDYEHAREYYKQVHAITQEIGDRLGEAHSLSSLAFCFDSINDRPQAIAHAQAALEILTAIESPNAQIIHDLLAKWQQAEE